MQNTEKSQFQGRLLLGPIYLTYRVARPVQSTHDSGQDYKLATPLCCYTNARYIIRGGETQKVC